MNLREGTRRLALLLGGAGAILGGFASYLELQPVLSQRARHNKFEQLANSDVVKQERKTLQTAPEFDPNAPYTAAPSSVTPTAKAMHRPPKPKTQSAPGFGPAEDVTPAGFGPAEESAPAEKQDDPFAAIAEPLASEVNTEEIKTINWSRDYGVDSIETQDGQTLYPTPAPSRWLYLLIALSPVVGFVIPWGVVRAIGWVGAGFVASSK